MQDPGAVARASVPSVLKRSYSRNGQQPTFPVLSNAWSPNLGVRAAVYLRELARTDRALPRQIAELNDLVRGFGPEAVAQAIEQASRARAFGADYIANILRQQRTPRDVQPPVRLKDPGLNQLATDELSLLGYDALIGIHNSEKEEIDS